MLGRRGYCGVPLNEVWCDRVEWIEFPYCEVHLRGVGRGLRVYGVNMNSTDCGPRVLGLLWPWTLMQSQFSDNWYDTLSISYEINIIQSNCALHECLQLLVFALTT